MLETLKSILVDFQEAQLETGVLRRMRLEPVRGTVRIVPAWRFLLDMPD